MNVVKEKNPQDVKRSGGLFPAHGVAHDSGNKQLDWNQSRDVLTEVMQSLPERDRQVFCLTQILGLPRGIVAETLAISEADVIRHAMAVRRGMRQYLLQHPSAVLEFLSRAATQNLSVHLQSLLKATGVSGRAEVRETALGSEDVVRALGQNQSVQRAIEEETVARKYVVRRYQTLVDRKYVQGLSSQETEEFEGLKTTLDALEQPFYERLIARVRMLVEEEGANA